MNTRTADERFGLDVKERRLERGWSMTELAAHLSEAGLTNFHAATIGRMERGERPVRLSEAVVIAGVFGANLDEMLTDPLVGDEQLKFAMEAIETVSKDAALSLHRVDFWRGQLQNELDFLDSDLAGEILPENVDLVRQTREDAGKLLAEDRVQVWLAKIEAMTDEERTKLVNSLRHPSRSGILSAGIEGSDGQ